MHDAILIAPGIALDIGGPSGGIVQILPSSPGALNFLAMQSRVWHLLREDGPDNGYPIPTSGDFPQSVVQRDLNIALGEFIALTGLAPGLSDRMGVFPVFAGQDYPLPPNLASITRVEYTPAGQQTQTLRPLSFAEWDNLVGAVQPIQVGIPQTYREPFAGYIRLSPAPSSGNAIGYPIGGIAINGGVTLGQIFTLTVRNNALVPVVITYTATLSDNAASVMSELSTLLNASAAVTGSAAFLQPSQLASTGMTFTALAQGATGLTYTFTVTAGGSTVAPTGATMFAPNPDTMTFYYSSYGDVLVYNGDTPNIPNGYHMAPVYRVLADYWDRKQDAAQAMRYLKKFETLVARAKAFKEDRDRATTPTLAGESYDDLDAFAGAPW